MRHHDQQWQELECFLFTETIIFVKKKDAPLQLIGDDPDSQVKNCTLKGSILRRDLEHVEADPDKALLISVQHLPRLFQDFQISEQADKWQRALADKGYEVFHETD